MTNQTERTCDEEQYASLMNTGKCAYAAIAEMVAALECDYDRLEELRNKRETLSDAIARAETSYNEAEAGSDEAEAKALDDARSMLEQWDEENGEELKELSDAAGDCKDRDEAEQRIQEDPLSVEVRGDWHTPGDSDSEPTEFRILLATGGPAVRIIGELNNGEPSSARLQVQDWFTPWTDYLEADGEVLLTYCRCFCFGE